MKLTLVYMVLFSCIFPPVAAANSCRSVVVVGHLYPLYEVYGEDQRRFDFDNLGVLVDKINTINNAERLILLGDTYFDGRDDVYRTVNERFVNDISLNVTTVLGNHEVSYLEKFTKYGGVTKQVIPFNGYNLIIFSPWKEIGSAVELSITDEDYDFFKDNLSKTKENVVLITDMVHHNNSDAPRWKSDIVPLLKSYNVRYVVVGDNDRIGHRYSWVELDGIVYINQGISHNFYDPNLNMFLEIQMCSDEKIKFIPHVLNYDGLSDLYKMNQSEFISRDLWCSYADKYHFPKSTLDKIYCAIKNIFIN